MKNPIECKRFHLVFMNRYVEIILWGNHVEILHFR